MGDEKPREAELAPPQEPPRGPQVLYLDFQSNYLVKSYMISWCEVRESTQATYEQGRIRSEM